MGYRRVKIMIQQDDKWFIGHMEDLAVTADQTGYVAFSDFLDDHQRSLLSMLEGRLPVRLAFFGGYADAQRVMAVFYPDYMADSLEEIIAEELQLLWIQPLDLRFVKRIPGHRDYLGALMGTGIRREKLGDLLTTEKGAYLWVKQEIAPYIMQELSGVGPTSVLVKTVEASEMPEPEAGIEAVVSVSSMRLDAVVSRGFNMGRSEAAKWIVAGKVMRNGMQVLDVDKNVTIGDKLTLRGKGLLKIKEDKGLSKSGRIQLLVERLGDKK